MRRVADVLRGRHFASSGVALLGALVLSLVLAFPAAAHAVPADIPADLVVTTNSDTVNGDVSSPGALLADPGPDGISLREAITAADNGGGWETITFAPSLDGETIFPQDSYNITQPGIAVTGTLSNGQPTVTLDAGSNIAPQIFAVRASNFTVSGLRMTDIGAGSYATGVDVTAGDAFSPLFVHDLRVEDNVFSNTGTPGSTRANAVYLSMQSTATGAEISNVTITGNSFSDFGNGSDGVLAAAGGSGGLLRNVGVEGNTFSNVTYSVEFGDSDTNGRVEGARIVGNTITGGEEPLDLNFIGNNGGPAATGNMIDGALVARNVIRDARGPDLVLLGGLNNASGNSITNTRIQDNVMSGDTTYGGVSIVGGRDGASNNVISGVQVTNDTIVQDMGGVSVNADLGGSGDSVSGVTVASSIIVGNSLDYDQVTPSQVSYSLSDQSGYAGANGNISGDPHFVNQVGGDFHLQEGSPAIDAGTSSGAPATDLECRARVDDPNTANTGGRSPAYYDMGAYEFGSPAADCLSTSISSGPATFTRSGSATFAFSSNSQAATFECSLDGAAFASCTSPKGYSGVGEGAHTFDVRTVSSDGNQDPAPATYGWMVDTTPPAASVDTHPASLSNSSAATFAFSATESSTFQCKLDTGSYAACTSPITYNSLADGPHTFSVEATDRAGNTGTAASYGWTIDTTPPVASIDTHPSSLTNSTTATFAFSANETSTFQCRLDSASFSDCTSSVSYNGIGDGTHTFSVQATDQAGNTGTPANYSWNVDTTPPALNSVNVDAPTIAEGTSTTLTASASGDAVAAEFYVDADAGAGSNTPMSGGDGTFTASVGSTLSDGQHTIGVRVRDAAGNWSPAQWTMLTVAPPVTLTVNRNGPGTGSVSSSPDGISCGATCSAGFDYGAQVTLTATPDHGSAFTGWSGGVCSGTGTCEVTLTADTTIWANFASTPTLTVAKAGGGSGTVSSDIGGIDCGATCAATIVAGTPVVLTATSNAGSAFAGWSGGGCAGTGTCHVTVDSDTTVTATFVATHTLTVAKSGSGTGVVSDNVGGIDCGATCVATVQDGTNVTLTAAASSGSAFAGWSGGGCSGTGTCQLTVTADTTVTATFAKQIQCVVPKVKSKTLTAAKHAITAAHCAVGKIAMATSKTVAKSKVISQKPPAGRRLTQGSPVNLVVSKGKPRARRRKH